MSSMRPSRICFNSKCHHCNCANPFPFVLWINEFRLERYIYKSDHACEKFCQEIPNSIIIILLSSIPARSDNQRRWNACCKLIWIIDGFYTTCAFLGQSKWTSKSLHSFSRAFNFSVWKSLLLLIDSSQWSCGGAQKNKTMTVLCHRNPWLLWSNDAESMIPKASRWGGNQTKGMCQPRQYNLHFRLIYALQENS